MTTNKTKKKSIRLDKSYAASTRFIVNETGNVEQKTTLYEESTGSQRQTVFNAKHCKLQVTKGGLLISFKFDRRKMPTSAISGCIYDETNLITDFIESEVGSRAIDNAEKEIDKELKRIEMRK